MRKEAEADHARRNSYAADMLVVQRLVEEGDLGRARALVRTHIPASDQTDLRGFEWRYCWERCRGDEVGTITENRSPEWHNCLSPDDRLLASGRKIWDLQTREISLTLATNESVVAFAPLRRILLLNDHQRGFKWRDLSTGQEQLLAPDERMVTVAFSSSGRWMATGRWIESVVANPDGNLSLWDTTTWKRVAVVTNLYFDELLPQALAFSPNEQLLIAATGNPAAGSDLRCFRVPSLATVSVPTNTARDLGCVVFSPDGREFFTGEWEGDVRVWDATTLREIEDRRQVGHHESWINHSLFYLVLSGSFHSNAKGSVSKVGPWGFAPSSG